MKCFITLTILAISLAGFAQSTSIPVDYNSEEECCEDENAEWNPCGTYCPEICGEEPRACVKMCKRGCQCKPGYILESEGGRCIPRSECECNRCEDPNAEWTNCGTYCPRVCGVQQPDACILMCKVGCQCKDGYILDQEGNCIPEEECYEDDCSE